MFEPGMVQTLVDGVRDTLYMVLASTFSVFRSEFFFASRAKTASAETPSFTAFWTSL